MDVKLQQAFSRLKGPANSRPILIHRFFNIVACSIIILNMLDSADANRYNESLIERGRILMDIGFIRSWNKEIRNMNEGKVGAPFEYSHS